ncbi:hypothetical protein [Saccharolobus caldissimus]|uniref:SpoVT-AbrB domain-containing protein n=1 Tax=Saccharolobus caldissimus TaxID=1702097 RepID=A0AAQ4CWV4_9CREN|nr:hypothetical protein [Saccharolobus caldissimus]BDC00286.1 hypothetical protein SACC_33020 [Saccharolobus caldissimus]
MEEKGEIKENKGEKSQGTDWASLLGNVLPQILAGLQDSFRDVLITFFKRNVIFKARIQAGRRITIPQEELEVAGIKEGDIVQVIIVPLKEKGE